MRLWGERPEEGPSACETSEMMARRMKNKRAVNKSLEWGSEIWSPWTQWKKARGKPFWKDIYQVEGVHKSAYHIIQVM